MGYRINNTEYAVRFNFEANIFGRKVSEHNDSVDSAPKVWKSLDFIFLNGIFLAEKSFKLIFWIL